MGRSVLHWVCVFALGAVPLVGCQEVVELTTIPFFIVESDSESLPDVTAPPSEGVQICQLDTDNCVTTDEMGEADLVVPSNQEVAYTFEKEGFGSRLSGDVTDPTFAGGSFTWILYANERLEAIAAQLGTPYPLEGSIVALVSFVGTRGDEGPAGATFTPVTSGTVGEAFYFDSATGQYSLDLEATTATTSTARLPLAQGGFTEVAPGEQQFEFGGTRSNCVASWAWPGDAPNTIRIPVRDGFISYGSIVCD
ncbi:MAG: hypothetical protein O7F08_02410 [Deltaproteobacteria bacterium]|nr:hypothetical protein [Deltaproteobacteria bacterium]